MRRSIDYARPDATEPLLDAEGDELPATSWVVAVSDDYVKRDGRWFFKKRVYAIRKREETRA